jgi:hypothetical protein
VRNTERLHQARFWKTALKCVLRPRLWLWLLLATLNSTALWAQPTTPDTPPANPEATSTPVADWFLDHVSIRQSLKDRNTINKPATAYLTFPHEGEAAKQVNGAVSIAFARPNPEFSAGLGIQFNENTMPDSRQNAIKAGLDSNWLRSIGPVERPKLFSDLSVLAGYTQNREKHTEGMSADAYWTFSAPATRCPWCPQLDIGGWLNYLPMIGAEYERTIRAHNPTDEGSVTRSLLELTVNTYPLRSVVGKRLIVTADVSHRYDVQSSFDGDRGHPFGVFSVSYGLDPYNIFLIGFDYVRGDNPDEGFEGQRFARISLKVQFDKPQKASILDARKARAARP